MIAFLVYRWCFINASEKKKEGKKRPGSNFYHSIVLLQYEALGHFGAKRSWHAEFSHFLSLSLDTRTHTHTHSFYHSCIAPQRKLRRHSVCTYMYVQHRTTIGDNYSTRGTRHLDIDETSLQDYTIQRWNTILQYIKIRKYIEKSFVTFLQKLHV